jgi:hypothetical protein
MRLAPQAPRSTLVARSQDGRTALWMTPRAFQRQLFRYVGVYALTQGGTPILWLRFHHRNRTATATLQHVRNT